MRNRQLELFNGNGTFLLLDLANAFPQNESWDVEYKSAVGGFPHDFWKSYSAFANTQGGIITLGVSEKKGKFSFEGLSDEQIHHYQKLFWDNANNPNTVNINLLQQSDIKVIDYEGAPLLAFRIPIAVRTQKPVYLTKNPFGNSYKRNYEGDYCCNNDEVRRMLADADQKLFQDSRILEGFDFNDLDIDSLKKYRQLFTNLKPAHPWLILGDKEFLEKLGGYRKDRITKKEGLTLAALLMFGKNSSIIDSECVPDFFPDFREYLGMSEAERWSDRIYPDGTWECNLLNFYLKTWPKLSSGLPKPFKLHDGTRIDESPAHVALRESFVNSLIHTDYSAPGNIVIEHYKDRYNFSNPGTLLVSLRQYYNGGISECRNPSLQKMFMMIGSAEKAGSGVNKIMAGWEAAHWRRPFLRIENQPDRLRLEMPMYSIIPENVRAELSNMFGIPIEMFDPNELTILSTCAIEGEISNYRLQYLLDIHRTDITALLQQLCKQGFLVSENKGRWTTYHLNYNYIKESENFTTIKEDGVKVKVDTSSSKVDTSTSKVDTSTPKVDTSTPKVDSLKENVDNERNNKRLPRKVLYKEICLICENDYKTLEDVSQILGKSADYLKNKIFPKMIENGLLERLYPNINHPHQAYKAKGFNEKKSI